MIEEGEKEAVEFEREEDPTLTCCQGKCVPKHPLHCCHFAVTEWVGKDLRTYACRDCSKMAKTKVRYVPQIGKAGPQL